MGRIACGWLMSLYLLQGFAGIGQRAGVQEKAEPEARQAAPSDRPVALTDEQFQQYERWVFGPTGVDGAREHLDATLQWKIRRVDDAFDLTRDQKKKLEVAGQGDIKRFFDGLRKQKEDPLRSRMILGATRTSRG